MTQGRPAVIRFTNGSPTDRACRSARTSNAMPAAASAALQPHAARLEWEASDYYWLAWGERP